MKKKTEKSKILSTKANAKKDSKSKKNVLKQVSYKMPTLELYNDIQVYAGALVVFVFC